MSPTGHPPSAGRRFILYHLPVILYAAGIIAVTSISDLRPPNLPVPRLDKVIHFLEYAVFAFLVFRSFYHLGKEPDLRRTLLLTALFVSFFALADETVQRFVPGRHSDWRDFAVDVAGAFAVLTGLGLFRRWRRRRSY